jgi:hypothetical protein
MIIARILVAASFRLATLPRGMLMPTRLLVAVILVLVLLALATILSTASLRPIWDAPSFDQGRLYVEQLQEGAIFSYSPQALLGSCDDYVTGPGFPISLDPSSFVDGCRMAAGG